MLKKKVYVFVKPTRHYFFSFLFFLIESVYWFAFIFTIFCSFNSYISWDLLSYIILYLPNFFFCLHLCVLHLWSIVFCLDYILSVSFTEDQLMAHSFWFYLSVEVSFGCPFFSLSLSFTTLKVIHSFSFPLIPILISPKIIICILSFKFLKNCSESLSSYQTTQGL